MPTWTYIQNLNIDLETSTQAGMLYANGKNTVKFIISFDALDENQNVMKLDAAPVVWGQAKPNGPKGGLQLIDYVTVAPLAYHEKPSATDEQSGWAYTDLSLGYNVAPPPPDAIVAEANEASESVDTKPVSRQTSNASTASTQLSTYVYCFPNVSPKGIGIRIITPGNKIYYCSKYIPSDGVSSQTNNSQVTITPLVAINYDNSNTKHVYAEVMSSQKDGHPHTLQANYYFSIASPAYWIKDIAYGKGFQDFGPDYFGRFSVPNTNQDTWYFIWMMGDPPEDTTVDYPGVTLKSINSQGPRVLTCTTYWMTQGYNGSKWSDEFVTFTITDQYGNSGQFSVVAYGDYLYLDIRAGLLRVDQN
jgi:hypothetical protein